MGRVGKQWDSPGLRQQFGLQVIQIQGLGMELEHRQLMTQD